MERQAAEYGALDMPLHLQNSLDHEREQLAKFEAQLGEVAASPASSMRSGNLPAPTGALIGREHEVAVVSELLRRANVRLVTLSGPGGIGKTRLSIQIAADLESEFANGAWFVELAPLRDTDLVLPTIAQTLGLAESGDRLLTARLKEYLCEQEMLLVLDNFEPVVEAAAQVAALLAAAPRVKALVSSREILRIPIEHDFAVPPIPETIPFARSIS